MTGAVPESSASTEPAAPLLRVLRGNPSPEQLAALIAVVAARSGSGASDREPPRVSGWNNPESRLRRPQHPGPGAWQAWA